MRYLKTAEVAVLKDQLILLQIFPIHDKRQIQKMAKFKYI